MSSDKSRFPKAGQWVRLSVCVLLMFWIFHVIFCNEAQLHMQQTGGDWNGLSRWEQRHLAWTRGPSELWRMARRLDALSSTLALVQCGLLVVFGALRWRQVLHVQGLDLHWREAVRISFVAHFFNAFLLGSTGGDVVKAWYAAEATHHRKAEAVVTVFVDRLIGIFSLLLFAVVMMPLNLDLILRFKRYGGLSLVVLGMLAAAGTAVCIGFFTNWLVESNRLSRWLPRLPGGESFRRGLVACRQFGRHRGFVAGMAGWSLVINLLVVGTFWALSHGLGLDVSWQRLFLVVPMIVCIAALPITPSGLGVRENLFVYLLTIGPIGLKHSEALSLSLLGYSANLIWSAMGGAIYMLMPNRARFRSDLPAGQVE